MQAAQSAYQLLHLPRGEAADFRGARSRRERRVDTIYIEGDVGRPVAHDAASFFYHLLQSHGVELLYSDHAHAGVIGKVPLRTGTAPDANLYSALRVQDACNCSIAEGASVVKFRTVEGTTRVGMGVYMYQATGSSRPTAFKMG